DALSGLTTRRATASSRRPTAATTSSFTSARSPARASRASPRARRSSTRSKRAPRVPRPATSASSVSPESRARVSSHPRALISRKEVRYLRKGAEDRSGRRGRRVLQERHVPHRARQRPRGPRLYGREDAPLPDQDPDRRPDQARAVAVRPDPRADRLPLPRVGRKRRAAARLGEALACDADPKDGRALPGCPSNPESRPPAARRPRMPRRQRVELEAHGLSPSAESAAAR